MSLMMTLSAELSRFNDRQFVDEMFYFLYEMSLWLNSGLKSLELNENINSQNGKTH